MKLTDLKRKKKSKEEIKSQYTICNENEEKYPYGTQLRFDQEEVEKLPILKKFSVGDYVNIQGEACVTSVRSEQKQNGKEKYFVEIQVEKINIVPKVSKSIKEMNPKEYKMYRETME